MSNGRFRLSLIAALDRNRLIGVDSERMPWHLSDDLRRFKRITLGKPVIMGRRTFESIGRPLPGRLNIVLTRERTIEPIDGQLQSAPSLEAARRLAENWIRQGAAEQATANAAAQATPLATDAEVMVIGGAQIYAQALADADRLYLTEIDAEFSGNVHFPAFEQMRPGWIEVAREQHDGQTDVDPPYAFVTYERDR